MQSGNKTFKAVRRASKAQLGKGRRLEREVAVLMYLEYVLFMKRMATVCASELHKETTVKKAQAITADLIRKVGPNVLRSMKG